LLAGLCFRLFAATGSTGTGAAVVAHRALISVGSNQSSNWSGDNQGAVEKGGKVFSEVSGYWNVPTATQHKSSEAEYSSTWVGIGGGCIDANCNATDGTLVQAGTEQDVSKSGVASYDAWYELIRAPGIQIPLTVKAGNRIYVNIAEAAPGSNVWTILVKNVTTAKSWTTTLPYSSTHATAEWIEETPVVISSNGNVTVGPLPKLSTVKIDPTTVNGSNPGLKASEELQLVDPNKGTVLATLGAPDADTDGFNDCTYATTCAVPSS
jgi:hypothetical protein